MARRTSESEFNWPVFAKRPEMASEGDETPLYATELGHSLETEVRGSTLSAEDMQLSSVLSGLKRDRAISERGQWQGEWRWRVGVGEGGTGTGECSECSWRGSAGQFRSGVVRDVVIRFGNILFSV